MQVMSTPLVRLRPVPGVEGEEGAVDDAPVHRPAGLRERAARTGSAAGAMLGKVDDDETPDGPGQQREAPRPILP